MLSVECGHKFHQLLFAQQRRPGQVELGKRLSRFLLVVEERTKARFGHACVCLWCALSVEFVALGQQVSRKTDL